MTIETVGQLAELLEGYDPDTPVRYAHQPSWPFEYTFGAVLLAPDTDLDPDQPATVWLTQGDQVRYLPGEISEALGWSR
ncbi:hypothetical protein [Haloechinothrix halophila]|uniref:hypothetical protein n=1 Tax=Haloechinothrix halophila TaxID=1069073 RepID=UPI0003FBB823|nr:hypothetical protein [Haloechinothrix halophila]